MNDENNSEECLLENSQIQIITKNTRSLLTRERRFTFANAINAHSYDIFCVSESWLTPDMKNSELFYRTLQFSEPTVKREMGTRLMEEF